MKYKELIKQMTLEEKASLLSGKDFWMSKSVDRLDIPSISFADGPHGIRKQADEADHLGLHAGLPATALPTASTIANNWDEHLSEEAGRLLGEEAEAYNVSVLLGPGLNIKRSPLCGRNFEYFSEDPYLSGKIAASYIRGIQIEGVSACPKHLAVNSQERLRMANDSVLDERTLRELYLTGFEIAVKEGKAKSIMTSYNLVNGTYANENEHLLQDILRDEWGFDGLVVTDWGGSNDHIEGIKAGSHLEMPATKGNSDIEVIRAVKNGTLPMNILDQRVDEFLQNVFKTKAYDDTGSHSFEKKKHHQLAQKIAEESIVLLKNEGKILPLKAGVKTAVIGDFAETPRYQGAGSSMVNPTRLDNCINSLNKSGLTITGYSRGFIRTGETNEQLKQEAVQTAAGADVVLFFMGLDESSESEGLDRRHMRIRENQIQLLEELNKVNQNIIVVLSSGSPVEMPWVDRCKALLYAGLSGQAGGRAVVNILMGEVCPSGKLSETYPILHKDTPAFKYYPGKERTSEYREGLYVGYRYYDTAGVPVRFPFGYGLSYTKFSYSNLTCEEDGVRFTVTNSGFVDGAEISQLYIGFRDGKVFRPKKELKGFAKTKLKAGESRQITINFDDKTFRYYNVDTKKFEIEGGEYQVYIGASSADIRLIGSIAVKGTNAVSPYKEDELFNYYRGTATKISAKEFETLLGRPLPPSKWNRSSLLGPNDTISQMFYAKSGIARLACRIMKRMLKKVDKSGRPNLNILFIYNMPFRGIAKMMGGAVDMPMVHSLLEMINGHFFRGFSHLVSSWLKGRKNRKELMKKLSSGRNEGY